MRLYIDNRVDESYSPKTITIQAGDHSTMMFDYACVTLENPEGWVEMDLHRPDGMVLDCFALRIVITANQQNGRDSRIRCVRIIGHSESLQGVAIK